MTASNPPLLATWLLGLTNSTAWKDAVAGDLFEEYQQRRAPAWYWCQVWIVVAFAVVKDLRHHWVLAFRALAVAFLVASTSNDVMMRYIGHLLRMASRLLGQFPSLFIAGALEPFLICAPAGLVVALTHRKCQAAMVLWYVAVVFVVVIWPVVNRVHGALEFALYCECTVSALVGAVLGGFLGIAWDHPPYRESYWASQRREGTGAEIG
jgi:hypothetical protein